MGNLFSHAPGQTRADALRAAVGHAHAAGNRALQELAGQRRPEIRCKGQPDFVHVDPGSGARHQLPAAQFHRQYQLCLEALEMTIYGYCVRREFGWERREEVVFSMRRPALWRRLVRPAPLIACQLNAGPGEEAAISFKAAKRPGYSNKMDHIIRLNQDLQDQLSRIHCEQIAARSAKSRIARWLRKLRGK